MISSQRTHVLLIMGYVMLLDVHSDPTCIQAAIATQLQHKRS